MAAAAATTFRVRVEPTTIVVACFCVFLMLAGAGHGAVLGKQFGTATWSGAPDGAGNQGGSCGYGDAVAKPPFSSMVAGFTQNESDCGACYRVWCTSHAACSKSQLVTVTITDRCRGSLCNSGTENVLELSGHAFGALALPGRADELRAAGTVAVQFSWIDCGFSPPDSKPTVEYPVFKIDPRATKEKFSIILMYTPGLAVGKVISVSLKNKGQERFQNMTWVQNQNMWTYTDNPVTPPMSISVSLDYLRGDSRNFVAEDVIPVGWQAGRTYFRSS